MQAEICFRKRSCARAEEYVLLRICCEQAEKDKKLIEYFSVAMKSFNMKQ
mgnify:FL=1